MNIDERNEIGAAAHLPLLERLGAHLTKYLRGCRLPEWVDSVEKDPDVVARLCATLPSICGTTFGFFTHSLVVASVALAVVSRGCRVDTTTLMQDRPSFREASAARCALPASSGSAQWPRGGTRRAHRRKLPRRRMRSNQMVGLEVRKAHLDFLAFVA